MRFKAPTEKDFWLDKGEYFFCHEFKSYFQGSRYDNPASMSDEYKIQIFDANKNALEQHIVKRKTSYKERTLNYEREALSLFTFDIKHQGQYKVKVMGQTENPQDVIFTIYKDINIYKIYMIASFFVFLIFVGSVLFLVWLIYFLKNRKIGTGID